MKQKYARDIQTQTNKHKLSFWNIRKPKRKSEKTLFIIKISLSVESEVIEKDIIKELMLHPVIGPELEALWIPKILSSAEKVSLR